MADSALPSNWCVLQMEFALSSFCTSYRLWRRWRRCVWQRLSQSAFRVVAIPSILALLGAIVFAMLVGIHHPRTQDEFSYLLAADTFTSGRVTNPPHPMWRHFETVQVIQQPTYASKYPPGQGLLLGFGQWAFGNPIIGVWVMSGLMCAAVSWMLIGWMPNRWAFFGGLLTVIQFGIGGFWAQSFIPAALPAASGALLLGAARRLAENPRVRHALIAAIALVLLANTRPWTGFVLATLPFSLILFHCYYPRRHPRWRTFTHVILPMAVVLAIGFAVMGYYNYRVTGDATCFPAMLHVRRYYNSPNFWFLGANQHVEVIHGTLQTHAAALHEFYLRHTSLQGFLREMFRKAAGNVRYYVGVPHAVSWMFVALAASPFLVLPCVIRDRWHRFAAGTLVLFGVGVLLITWDGLHYAAPGIPLVMLLKTQGLRHIRTIKLHGRRIGVFMCLFILSFHIVVLLPEALRASTINRWHWPSKRAAIVESLHLIEGDHLVFVDYGSSYAWTIEWVYNRANIDSARIVWARYLGLSHDQELIDYYPTRRLWRVDLSDGSSHPRLKTYAEGH